MQQFIALCEKYDLGFPDAKLQQQVIWDSIKSIMWYNLKKMKNNKYVSK